VEKVVQRVPDQLAPTVLAQDLVQLKSLTNSFRYEMSVCKFLSKLLNGLF